MTRQLVSFDWAMKHLLCQKANFDILEGFLSELLEEDITIIEILESESNQDVELDKFNRVDLKAKDSQDNIVVIEVQYRGHNDYPHRILWGVSKAVTEMLHKGGGYENVKKIFSISIVYFDFGQGDDVVYHGTTRFWGRYKQKNELQLSKIQQNLYHGETITDIYPEFYIIKVNAFDDIILDPLSEWLYFMKNEKVKDEFSAKGIAEAKERFNVLKMPNRERINYDRYIEDKRTKLSVLKTARLEGLE